MRKGDFLEDQVSHLIASGSDSDEEDEDESVAQRWRDKFAGVLGETESPEGEKEKKCDSEFVIESKATGDSDDSDNLLSDEDPEMETPAVSPIPFLIKIMIISARRRKKRKKRKIPSSISSCLIQKTSSPETNISTYGKKSATRKNRKERGNGNKRYAHKNRIFLA